MGEAMKMSVKRRALFDDAIQTARRLRRADRLDDAFEWLERAHVIGQPWVVPHLVSHWEMLIVGVLRFDAREIAGQLLRLALTAPGTWVGRLPEGNTGGADVNPFRPMPIAPELQRQLAE